MIIWHWAVFYIVLAVFALAPVYGPAIVILRCRCEVPCNKVPWVVTSLLFFPLLLGLIYVIFHSIHALPQYLSAHHAAEKAVYVLIAIAYATPYGISLVFRRRFGAKP